MANIKGVDISYCQSGLNYGLLAKNGVKFAIIRVGYSCNKDALLDTHVKGCIKEGIKYGFYVYSRATSVKTAIAEADACIAAITAYPCPEYPIFYDLEAEDIAKSVSKSVHTDCAIAFCDRLVEKGYFPGIYANPSWLENYYDKSRLIGKYDIWLAHWTEDPNYPSKYKYGQTMWQWGIDKIGMDIDGDICFIDYPSKIAHAKAGNASSSAEANKPCTDSSNTGKGENKVPTSSNNTSGLTTGTAVTLNKTSVYVSSTAKSKAGTLTGKYFILSPTILNGRIRVTTPKGNSVCTGWVNVSDITGSSSAAVTMKRKDALSSITAIKNAGYSYEAVTSMVKEVYGR